MLYIILRVQFTRAFLTLVKTDILYNGIRKKIVADNMIEMPKKKKKKETKQKNQNFCSLVKVNLSRVR